MGFTKRHPLLWAVLGLLFASLPQWLQAVWGLFSSQPIVPTIASKIGGIHMTEFNPSWLSFVTVPIGGLFMYLIWKETRKPKPQTEPKLDCKPSLLLDPDYGSEHGTALYITVKVTGMAKAVRGRLVSILPTSDKTSIARIPSLNFPSGLLQWSARYGGGELASFVSECELDVLAFENEDDAATVAYLNDSFRKNKLLLDTAVAWAITVEVFAEGSQSCFCNFRVRRGKERVFALASPRGTLYEPVLEVI